MFATKQSLKFQLVTRYVLFVMVIVFAVGMMFTLVDFRKTNQAILQLQQETLGKFGYQIEDFFEDRIDDLLLIQSTQDLKALSEEEQKVMLSNLMSHSSVYHSIHLLNDSGLEAVQVSRTASSARIAQKDHSGEAYFKVPFSTGDIYFSPVQFDPEIREPLFLVSFPITDLATGKFDFVLVVELRFKPVWNLLNTLEIPEDFDLYITDQEGKILAHRNPTIALSQEKIELPETDGRTTGLNGEEVLLSQKRQVYGDQTFIIVIEQALKSAHNNLGRDSLIGIVVTILLSFATAGLTIFFSEKVLSPLQRISDAARAMGEGDFSVPMEISDQGEIGDLAKSFDQMRDRMDTIFQEMENEVISGRKAESSLRGLNQELEEIVAARTNELLASNEELTFFSYSIAHDLRAPLRAISGFSELIKTDPLNELDEESAAYLETIIQSAKRMDDQIHALLHLASLSQHELNLEEINIEQIGEEIFNQLIREEAGDRDISFVTQRSPEVMGDRQLLEIVLTNLISNAIKFSSPRRKTVITLGYKGTTDHQAVFFVQDNGIGFEIELSKAIFTPFQRLQNDDSTPGMGIGLTIAMRALKRHHGSIWAEAEPGKGATFFFAIPLE